MRNLIKNTTTGAALLVLFAGPVCAQQIKYRITDLGTLGGNLSVATAINDQGQVVGRSTLPGEATSRAYLWDSSVMTDLRSLGGTFAGANALNDQGQAVGFSELTGNTARHAVLFQKGRVIDLGALPASQFSTAFGINNRGEIVGGSTTTGRVNSTFHATAFTGSDVIDLGTLGGPTSFVTGINDHGEATGRADRTAGSSCVVFADATINDLGLLPGGTVAFGRAINNRGDVACQGNTAGGGLHAALHTRKGEMIDLGILGGTLSDAAGINDKQEVVGFSTIASGAQRAFIWSDGVITNLNTLIDLASGWTLTQATGINNRGQIVGNGVIGGAQHAFLLTPLE